jgi:hypothetical protein
MRFILAMVLIAGFATAGEPLFTGKLSGLARTDAGLGAGWKPRPGMVIDNVDDLSGTAAQEKAVAEMVASQVKPHGVQACADFSYNVDGQPLQFVTLRVFVFADTEKANAFYKLKYTSEVGAKFYNKVDAPVGSSVDSNEINKRIWLIGNVLMTCSELKSEGNHIKVLNAFALAMKLVAEK